MDGYLLTGLILGALLGLLFSAAGRETDYPTQPKPTNWLPVLVAILILGDWLSGEE